MPREAEGLSAFRVYIAGLLGQVYVLLWVQRDPEKSFATEACLCYSPPSFLSPEQTFERQTAAG